MGTKVKKPWIVDDGFVKERFRTYKEASRRVKYKGIRETKLHRIKKGDYFGRVKTSSEIYNIRVYKEAD